MSEVPRIAREDRYMHAYAVPIETRMDGLRYVLDCVKKSYGPDGIALRNVAELVDGMADAVARDDRVSAFVRGLRLLSEVEMVELWQRLGGHR